MNATTAPMLFMTASFRQRSLAAIASVVITAAVIAGNLQLAQEYAHAIPTGTDIVQTSQAARG